VKRINYRISVYWEEMGGLNEGWIRGEQHVPVKLKPRRSQMERIGRELRHLLKAMGLLKVEV
jgi:hypothetical protein